MRFLKLTGMALVGMLMACRTAPAPPPASPMSLQKTARTPNFHPGPPLQPADGLRTFLREHPNAYIAARVTIEYADDFPAGITSAYFGWDTELAPGDRVVINLDDGRMGIPLATHCAGETRCQKYIQGTWAGEYDADGVGTWYVRGVSEEPPSDQPFRLYCEK